MIRWWVPDNGAFLFESYAAGRGKEIAHRLLPSTYRSLTSPLVLAERAHIFGGIDQLHPVERLALGEVYDALSSRQPHVRLLNDPRKVLCRYDLLKRLHATGINQYNVWFARDASQVDAFPVFLRSNREHTGPLSGLLHTPDDILQAIRSMRLRGVDMDDLMIVQHVDAREDDGFVRKYAAFYVAGTVITSHVLAHEHWMVKSEGSQRTMAAAEREGQFQNDDRFDVWIRRAFQEASIDYGRIDFGLVRGAPQLWEINMHPTVGRGRGGQLKPTDAPSKALEAVRTTFHERLRSAFAALDDESIAPPEPLTFRISAARAADIQRVRRAGARRSGLYRQLSRVYHSRVVGAPLRWMYGRLFPRR